MEGAAGLAGGDDGLGHVLAQALDAGEGHAEVLALHLPGHAGTVHVDGQGLDAVALGVLHHHLHRVEAHGLGVQQGAVEGPREVALQPGGDVGQQGEGGSVALAEAVAGEAQQVVEDGVGGGWVHAPLGGAGHEIGPPALHGLAAALAAHGAPQAVGLGAAEAGQGHGHPQHLLLVDDDAQGLGQDGLEGRVPEADRLLAIAAGEVGLGHAALHGAGADEGHLHGEVGHGAGAEARQEVHLGPALDLEAADGVGGVEHLPHVGVVGRHRVQRQDGAAAVGHALEGLGHQAQGAQAEEVDLDEAGVLDVVLVPLHHHPSGHGGRLQRHQLGQRPAGDDHAADVDGEVARAAVDLAAEVHQQLPRQVAQLVLEARHLGQLGRDAGRVAAVEGVADLVEELGREAQDLAHVGHRRAGLEGDDVGHHGRPVGAVAFVDVLDDLLAPVGGEVDVDVGRGRAALGQEALEEEAVGQRVHRRDAQDVGHDAAGGRAAALAQDAPLPGEVHQVVDHQEVLGQPAALDDAQLPRQLLHRCRREGVVAAPEAGLAQVVEVAEGGLAGRDGELGQADGRVVQLVVAALGDAPGVGDGLGQVGEEVGHLVGGLEVAVGGGEEDGAGLVQTGAGGGYR